MTSLRIAMIGLGDIAQKAYLPILAADASVTPVLCTRNQATLAQLTKKYRINEHYSDINQLIASQPDAVMVHTSTASHFSIAKQLLNAGIATFVDKPISYDINECEQLIALARASNTPLYLGFNRRFAPKIAQLASAPISHLRWQKNRVNLPDKPDALIFNDFIHVVDGLCFLAGKDIEQLKNLQVFGQFTEQYSKQLLANIRFSFECGQRVFEGSMNRLSGTTEEIIEAFGHNEKYVIEGLTTGQYYKNGEVSPIGFSDWDSYLYSRGFVDMMDDWLKVIQQGHSNEHQLKQIETSHQLCQQIIEKLPIAG